MGNLTYGLHPSLGTVTGGINNGIHELWAQGKMAIVTNVGTLGRADDKNAISKPFRSETVSIIFAFRSGFAISRRTFRYIFVYGLGRQNF